MSGKNFNFNHRITLQKEVQNENEFGGITNKFENIANVWGKITPLRSINNYSRMKEEIENTHIVEVRYAKEYEECKKITFGEREFQITGYYSPNEAHELLVFNVREIL